MYSQCKFDVDLYRIDHLLQIWLKILIYLSVLYFFVSLFLLNIYNTYERSTKPENLGFCYQPISMTNNITRHYQRRIKNPVDLLR